jgi:hypothetical protein
VIAGFAVFALLLWSYGLMWNPPRDAVGQWLILVSLAGALTTALRAGLPKLGLFASVGAFVTSMFVSCYFWSHSGYLFVPKNRVDLFFLVWTVLVVIVAPVVAVIFMARDIVELHKART